jgi:hypothetical protein
MNLNAQKFITVYYFFRSWLYATKKARNQLRLRAILGCGGRKPPTVELLDLSLRSRFLVSSGCDQGSGKRSIGYPAETLHPPRQMA